MIPTMFNDLQPSAGQSQPPADASTAASIPVTAFTPTQIQKWELGVALILHTWRALSDAVASGWGGPESSDKRDWLCGAIAEMFEKDPETDEYDVETTLAGVMEDEFELALEDDSAYEVCGRGEAEGTSPPLPPSELRQTWQLRRAVQRGGEGGLRRG